MINLELVVLGSGCATPIPTRWHSAFAVLFYGEPLLFEAGEGVQIRLQQARINSMKINHIFITHLHGDHCFGIPGLIFSMDLQGRTKPVTIHGPVGLKSAMRKFLTATEHTVKFKVKVHEIPVPKRGKVTVLDEKKFKVLATPVKHSIAGFAYAFVEKDRLNIDEEKLEKLGVKKKGPFLEQVRAGRTVTVDGIKVRPKDVLVERKGRKIVFSGDTRPLAGIVSLARGAQILVHEATYTEDLKDKALSHKHSTASEAASVAKKAGVELLILTHFSRRYRELKAMRDNARKIFEATTIGEDLMRVRLY